MHTHMYMCTKLFTIHMHALTRPHTAHMHVLISPLIHFAFLQQPRWRWPTETFITWHTGIWKYTTICKGLWSDREKRVTRQYRKWKGENTGKSHSHSHTHALSFLPHSLQFHTPQTNSGCQEHQHNIRLSGNSRVQHSISRLSAHEIAAHKPHHASTTAHSSITNGHCKVHWSA